MAKKIPVPKAKSTTSFPLSSSLIGLASLFNRRPLMLSKLQGTNPASWGTKAWRANKLTNLSKMGKWARMGRFAAPALMNPWLAVPAALLGGAKYAVGKAFDPYRDETGKIGAAGNERLLQERLAREELAAANRAKREGTWLGKLDERMLNQLSSAGMNEGGLAGLL
jgi:hypothetical protein